MRDNWRWRIALSQAALETVGAMIYLGIPNPDGAPFAGHTTKQSQSEGGIARHGYLNMTLLWGVLDGQQGYELKTTYVEVALATKPALLFMTVPIADGSTPGLAWKDVEFRPNLSNLTPTVPVMNFSQVITYANVTLELNNIRIVNETPTW